MTDIEARLAEALHAQADGLLARHPDPAMARRVSRIEDSNVILLAPEARRHERGRGWKISASAIGAAAAVVSCALAVNLTSHRASHDPAAGPKNVAVNAAAAGHQALPLPPYGLRPGQYLKVTQTGSGRSIWIPADPNQEWRSLLPNAPKWGPPADETAKCAAFPAFAGAPGCADLGWTGPYRPQFAQDLPTNPAAILASLRSAVPKGAGSPDELLLGEWNYGTSNLVEGVLPDSVAKNVEAALRLVPQIVVTHGVRLPNGQVGDMLSVRLAGKTMDGHTRFVDPKTGAALTNGSYQQGVVFDPNTGRVLGNWTWNPTVITTVDGRTGTLLSTPRVYAGTDAFDVLNYKVVLTIHG
jgi:hypothetical protein